jgi:hypothetical protein
VPSPFGRNAHLDEGIDTSISYVSWRSNFSFPGEVTFCVCLSELGENRQMDVFVHIPKSSGSTIRSVMSREYGVASILYFEPGSGALKKSASEEDYLRRQLSRRPIRLITGHHRFGIHSMIRMPCRYFAVVRDPIDRALSDYYYAFSYDHHRFRDEIVSGKLDVREFLTSGRYAHGNEQTAMLAGTLINLNGIAEAAIDNVRNSFMVVGTAERFEESILLIAKALGWKPPLFVNKNVTRLPPEAKAARARVSNEAHQECARYFRVDYQVYHATDEYLSEVMADEGAPFGRALEAFREIQADIARRAGDRVFELYEFQKDDQLPDFAARVVGSEPYRLIEEYINNSKPMSRPAKNYDGQVDAAKGQTILGWATDLSDAEPIDITVWRSGQKVDSARCDLFREDLIKAGFPKRGMGFRVDLGAPIGDVKEYDVCFDQTRLRLRWQKHGSLKDG